MDTSLLSYVSHFRQFYARSFEDVGDKYQLTQLEIDILLFLHNNPERNTARDIVELRGFAKSNVSTAVESLRKKGYLLSEPDPESRKIRRLTLAEAKLEPVMEFAACQEQGFAAMLRGFTAEELQLLSQFLKRIDGNLLEGLKDLEQQGKG